MTSPSPSRSSGRRPGRGAASLRARGPDRHAHRRTPPRRRRRDAEDRLGDGAAPRADEAGHADDLAGADRERHVARRRRSGPAPRPAAARSIGRAPRAVPPGLRRPDRGRPASGRPSGVRRRARRAQLTGAVATCLPSRSTVTVSTSPSSSSRRCEMKTTEMPRSRRRADDAEEPLRLGRRQGRGRLVEDEQTADALGQRPRDLDELHLADRESGGQRPRIEGRVPARPGGVAAARTCRRRSIVPRRVFGWSAHEDVLGDVEMREELGVLIDGDDPLGPGASMGVAKRTGLPSSSSSPLSAVCSPVTILTRVDLPAPFSPRSAWISAGWTAKLTSSSARIPSKRLVMPRSSRRGGTRAQPRSMAHRAGRPPARCPRGSPR